MLNDGPVCAVFRALGDPTRLWFVEALQDHEVRLFELCEIFPLSRATVLHHLAVLQACGLVTSRKLGPSRLYGLRPEGFTEAARRLRHLAVPAGNRGPPFYR